MKLNAENVTNLFKDCLFLDDENRTGYVVVEGLLNKYGFHPGRLEKHKKDISSFIDQLPFSFRGNEGDNFLKMCNNHQDELWTGFHKTMEELLALGIAIGEMKYTKPRSEWNGLPDIMITEETIHYGKEEYVGKIPERTELPVIPKESEK